MDSVAEKPFTVGRWMRATFWGWLLGIIFIIGLSSVLDSMGIEDMQFYLGIGMGAGVGLTQWLFLRKRTAIGAQWLLFSAVGMGLPFMVLDLLMTTAKMAHKLPLGVALGAVVTGVLQFMILKNYSQKAHLWIWSSVVGWTVAIAIVLIIDHTMHLQAYVGSNLVVALINLVLILLGGVVLGITTGIALKKILKENSGVEQAAQSASA